MSDPTEAVRRELAAEINTQAAERQALEAKYGQVWNTDELQKDFEVLGFSVPFVVVNRRVDKQQGTLTFQHSPRYYFGFTPVSR